MHTNPDVASHPTGEILSMKPKPGERLLHFVGDRVRIELKTPPSNVPIKAFLRTTLGRDRILRQRAMTPITGQSVLPGSDWRNIPMRTLDNRTWWVECTLTEPGFFWAKAYYSEPNGQTHWPEGDNLGISVHPAALRSGNTIYCAFPRLFGATKEKRETAHGLLDSQFQAFDDNEYTLIPPSGTLRDLTKQLPHIIDRLGCRILHLLPVNPTPTTYARMGRYGSPYAALDLTSIDPALVEFDKKYTGVDQFCELTRETHHRGARIMLDLVINHTGWGSWLHENHPQWFVREKTGEFKSPGAWGVVWGDLVEMDQSYEGLWEHIANAFLTWCRRGVDGFRCDAGYMIPVTTWKAITATVREEFPETIFFLEGLGGPWDATENLLTRGRMQWAYSELFQNYDGEAVATYNDHSIEQNRRVGLLVHFSETHDNERLAKKGKRWSLLRNRLCALASHSGGFGFTCGVEWLAAEKIDVHQCRGLNWGARDNIVDEIATLNHLLQNHPCFHDGATCRRLSERNSVVYAMERQHHDPAFESKWLLILANTDMDDTHQITLDRDVTAKLGPNPVDLLQQSCPTIHPMGDGSFYIELEPGDVFCLSAEAFDVEEHGRRYMNRRKRHAMAVQALAHRFEPEEIGGGEWRALAELFNDNPFGFLGAVYRVHRDKLVQNAVDAMAQTMAQDHYVPVCVWDVSNINRVMVIPYEHWLLVSHTDPFRITFFHGKKQLHHSSIPTRSSHVAVVPPGTLLGNVSLEIDSRGLDGVLSGSVRFLGSTPDCEHSNRKQGVALLTNGRGGMARLQLDLGTVASKYDCVLATNPHPRWPVDRHILVKRIRAWVVSDGFSQALNSAALERIESGTTAKWDFKMGACGGFAINLSLEAAMVDGKNCTLLRFKRGDIESPYGMAFPKEGHMMLIVRVDMEDRSFHAETKYSEELEKEYSRNMINWADGRGFEFKHSSESSLKVFCREGSFISEPEWIKNVPHSVDSNRGQTPSGDCFSPGWFNIDLRSQEICTIVLDGDNHTPVDSPLAVEQAFQGAKLRGENSHRIAALPDGDVFGGILARAVDSYVVKRDEGKTVIAGYPWFLDWGRDTLICARGLLATGRISEVADILKVFGRFVDNGTLPNCIHGHDVSNRDTSDAPLWYGIVVGDLVAKEGTAFYSTTVGNGELTISDVLINIGTGYINGTENGIHMDPKSGLIWSPSHYTWMDTNHPAATPRQGYPVEIQVLWIRLLKQLSSLKHINTSNLPDWTELARQAEGSFMELYWDESRGYLADCILADYHTSAKDGILDTALRSNCLFAVSLDVIKGKVAQQNVLAAITHLIVPGAIRSLAPLEVEVPLTITDSAGKLLNNPYYPYSGTYDGDEDTQRKPAYHNGTAWTWSFPVFCEALVKAWNNSTEAVNAAISYLSSMDALLNDGCIGHIPEILNGDAPHFQRGCDAQAWGATEAIRVWKWLGEF